MRCSFLSFICDASGMQNKRIGNIRCRGWGILHSLLGDLIEINALCQLETHSSSSNSVCGDFLRSVEESSFIDEINASNEYFKNSQTLLIPIIPILYNFHSFGPAVNVSKRSRRIRRKKNYIPSEAIAYFIINTENIHNSFINRKVQTKDDKCSSYSLGTKSKRPQT